MKSALALIAFAKPPLLGGIMALLETALDALDQTEERLAAAYVEQALEVLRARSADDFGRIPSLN